MAQARVERIVNLIAYLSDSNIPRTANEILETIPGYSDNFDAAKRAFERDKEEMRFMGFDVIVANTPSGETGYQILKENTYYDVELSGSQRNILQYALAMYSPQEQSATSTLAKLGVTDNRSESNSVTALPMPEIVDELYQACNNKEPIEIIFKEQKRCVTPLRLIARGGYWYFEAIDMNKNESRTFRVDRISSIDSSVKIVEDIEANEISIEKEEPVTLKVKVHPHIRKHFCESWNGTYDDKTDVITFDILRPEIFISKIFEYSGFVKVIEPKDLANQIDLLIDSSIQKMEE